MNRLFLLGWLLLGCADAPLATKPLVRVTPTNIADQPHALTVDSQDREGATLFTVTLMAKKGTPIKDEACTLTIVSSGRTVDTVRPHAARVKNAVTFEFQLARDAVAESMLSVYSANATAETFARAARLS